MKPVGTENPVPKALTGKKLSPRPLAARDHDGWRLGALGLVSVLPALAGASLMGTLLFGGHFGGSIAGAAAAGGLVLLVPFPILVVLITRVAYRATQTWPLRQLLFTCGGVLLLEALVVAWLLMVSGAALERHQQNFQNSPAGVAGTEMCRPDQTPVDDRALNQYIETGQVVSIVGQRLTLTISEPGSGMKDDHYLVLCADVPVRSANGSVGTISNVMPGDIVTVYVNDHVYLIDDRGKAGTK